jgi:propionyl-CoA carboxylase alpha chain
MFYDPMIAKLCTHASTRDKAIDGMAAALDEFRIDGINHNIAFLTAIMHNAKFRSGKISTAFIAEEFPDGFHGITLDDAASHRFVAAAVIAKMLRTGRAAQITGTLNGAHRAASAYTVVVGERSHDVKDASVASDGQFTARIDGKAYAASTDWKPGQSTMHLQHQGTTYAMQLTRTAGGYKIGQGGTQLLVTARSPFAAKLASAMPKKAPPDTSKMLLCPMPGLVVSVNVHEGQDVKAGEALAVVEAMKMENVLTAERDATVKKINAKKGDSLALDDVILEFA